jgi:hypothetical protein
MCKNVLLVPPEKENDMKFAKLTLTAAASLMMMPIAASAEPAPANVAASLSASFGGNNGSASLLDEGVSSVVAPTSVSVAAASGGMAVATSVATANSTGAAAGASSGNMVPIGTVTNSEGGAYETTVTFFALESTFADQIAALQAAIDDINGDLTGIGTDIADLQTQIDAICGNGFTATFLGDEQRDRLSILSFLSVGVTPTGTVTVECAVEDV